MLGRTTKYWYVSLFIGTLLFALHFLTGTTQALGYSNLPVQLPDPSTSGIDPKEQYINISDDYQHSNGAGVDHPTAWVKFYSKIRPAAGINYQITFYHAYDPRDAPDGTTCGGDAGTGPIQFDYFNLGAEETKHDQQAIVNSGQNPQGIAYDIMNKGCRTITRTIPSSAFALSNLPGHEGLYTAGLKISINDPQQGKFFSYFFTIGTNTGQPNPGDEAHIDYLPIANVTTPCRPSTDGSVQCGTDIYPYNAKNDPPWGGLNDISMPFRPSCTQDNNYPISYSDDDYSTPNQLSSAGMELHLLTYDATTGNQLADTATQDPNTDGDVLLASERTSNNITVNGVSVAHDHYFSGNKRPDNAYYFIPNGGWKAGKAYKLVFENVNGGNGISILPPADAGDFYLGCKNPPNPQPASTTITCNNVSVIDPGSYTISGHTYKSTRTIVWLYGETNLKIIAAPAGGSPIFGSTDIVGQADDKATSQYGPATTDPNGDAQIGKIYTFTSTGNDDGGRDGVHLKVVRQYYDFSTNAWVNVTSAPEESYSRKCHNATCSLNVTGDLGRNKVLAGKGYTVDWTITNFGGDDTSAIPQVLSGQTRFITQDGQGTHDTGGATINPGDPTYGGYDVGPVADTGKPYSVTITAYPQYSGNYANISWQGGSPPYRCTATFDVYEPFHLKLGDPIKAKLMKGSAQDNENPDHVAYNGSIDSSVNYPVNSPNSSYACFYQRPHPNDCTGSLLVPQTSGGTYNQGTNNLIDGSWATPNPNAGDTYCTFVHLNYTDGFVGPSSDVVNPTGGPLEANPCSSVENEPYVHALGADVSAGGGFGAACSVNNAGIKTFLKTTGDGSNMPSGSGVQIGALSIDPNNPIKGFSSAMLRDPAGHPRGSTDLSFANTSDVVSGSGPGAPATGGRLGGSHCASDFWADLPTGKSSFGGAGSFGGPSVGSNTYYFTPSGNQPVVITGSLIKGSDQVSVFVDGDVVITDDIKYESTAWDTPDQIPSFRLVARNIYIASNVKQLDGLYVAQPKSGDTTNGKINTCVRAANPYSVYGPTDSDYFNDCNNQLVVNGAFVSQHVYLSRTYASLRSSYPGEHLFNNNPGLVCADSTSNNNGTCAAEIFNFSPEMFFARPPGTTQESGPTTGKYDYITSLAPVL